MNNLRQEQFEAWIKIHFGKPYPLDKFSNGDYVSLRVRAMWDTWLAATDATYRNCAELCGNAPEGTPLMDMAEIFEELGK